MNANDKTEKVLREIHIMLSKAEPYKPEPSRVIINKQQMIDLLAELNKCIYAIQDEYELTEQSRNHAEREFRKKGDQIVWDASRKAEDVYAASVIYTEEVATEEGKEIGKEIGERQKIISLVVKKLQKDKSVAEIADDLEEKEEVIAPIYEAALSMKPDYDVEKIYELLEKNKKLA